MIEYRRMLCILAGAVGCIAVTACDCDPQPVAIGQVSRLTFTDIPMDRSRHYTASSLKSTLDNESGSPGAIDEFDVDPVLASRLLCRARHEPELELLIKHSGYLALVELPDGTSLKLKVFYRWNHFRVEGRSGWYVIDPPYDVVWQDLVAVGVRSRHCGNPDPGVESEATADAIRRLNEIEGVNGREASDVGGEDDKMSDRDR